MSLVKEQAIYFIKKKCPEGDLNPHASDTLYSIITSIILTIYEGVTRICYGEVLT